MLCIVKSKHANYYCRLCLTEKFFIVNSIGDNRVLTKRSEVFDTCRLQHKYMIKNSKLKDSMD